MIAPPKTMTPSPDTLHTIGTLLTHRTGQELAANRMWRIEATLKPLMRANGVATLDALVALLGGEHSAGLSEAIVEALLNQESSFFRDAGVIEQVGEAAAAMQAAAGERRLRLWSAGCSTGQEPLSLAMLFAEAQGAAPFPDIQASDVSPAAIARARSGRYTQFEVQRGLAVRRMVRWFEPAGADWVAAPDLVARVQYRRHNLVADPPLPGRFDIILCRNVLLYLSAAVRRQVLGALAGALRPEGLLVLGASETVIGLTDALTPCPKFRGFYRKGTPARPAACIAGAAAAS